MGCNPNVAFRLGRTVTWHVNDWPWPGGDSSIASSTPAFDWPLPQSAEAGLSLMSWMVSGRSAESSSLGKAGNYFGLLAGSTLSLWADAVCPPAATAHGVCLLHWSFGVLGKLFQVRSSGIRRRPVRSVRPCR